MKKGSMQLSINTIVMLVLALALLGIIVSAFAGVFEPSEEKLVNMMLRMDAGMKATSTDVIAGADALAIRRGRYQTIAASFYNKNNEACTQGAAIVYDCPQFADSNNVGASFKHIDIKVPIGEERTLPAVIRFSFNAPAKEYICLLRVQCGGNEIVAEEHSVFNLK